MVAPSLSKQYYYLPEKCAFCIAPGSVKVEPCEACDSKGIVLVYQPSSKCPPCMGTGKAKSKLDSRLFPRCDICEGTGWARHIKIAKGDSKK